MQNVDRPSAGRVSSSAVSRVLGTLRSWSGLWVGLVAGCAIASVALDALLLEMSQKSFTAGIIVLVHPLRGPGVIADYFLSSLSLDIFLVLLAWALVFSLRRKVPRTSILAVVAATAAGLFIPFLFNFVRYGAVLIFGPRIDLGLLFALADGSLMEMLSYSGAYLLPVALGLLGAACVTFVAVLILRRLDLALTVSVVAAPALAAVWVAFAVSAVVAIFSLSANCVSSIAVCTALLDKPSGKLLSATIRASTDVDGDGFGAFARPADPAAFDADIYPWALDQPGNGVDENGLAGDHPVGFPAPDGPIDHPQFASRPHVLLIFLESFRGDLLEKSLNGREITPFINRLAAEGVSSKHAYANVAGTIRSRIQLFTGRLSAFPGDSSLLHDFKNNGYTVGYFSGQNESFGALSEVTVAVDVADVFYDARQDPDRNYAPTKTPGTMAVSWKLLNERTASFLDSQETESPLFLYVNFHDAHFAYHHAEMDDILGVEPIARHQIRPGAAAAIWENYANAAANVDRAVEELVARFRASIGGADHTIVITADHGESLFERGVLGHGLLLATEETRVPLVLWGARGEWPEPISIADVRPFLQRSLSIPREGTPPAVFVPDPDRRILQFAAYVRNPSLLRLRGIERTFHYDVRADELEVLTRSDEPADIDDAEREAGFTQLIHTWESASLEDDRRRAAYQERSQAQPSSGS